jgi:hypothetical protein
MQLACPTSDHTGPLGAFILLLVILLVFLMLYLVCGTLYNRFVLNLSGFDQIPQFSWTSLKYHASEAAGNLREYAEAFYQPQRRSELNPHSHQTMHGSAVPDGVRSGEGTPRAAANEPWSGRGRRFDLERGPGPEARGERGSSNSAAHDGEREDTATTPTLKAPGIDPKGVIRL